MGFISVIAFTLSGRNKDAEIAFDQYRRNFAAVSPFEIASLYALQGDRDSAMAWLEKAYQAHCPPLEFIRFWPFIRDLRDDTRYQTLLVKLKLTE